MNVNADVQVGDPAAPALTISITDNSNDINLNGPTSISGALSVVPAQGQNPAAATLKGDLNVGNYFGVTGTNGAVSAGAINARGNIDSSGVITATGLVRS